MTYLLACILGVVVGFVAAHFEHGPRLPTYRAFPPPRSHVRTIPGVYDQEASDGLG